MTNAEIVSRVINGLNSVNKDARISKRYILHTARKKSEFLIAQKLNDRSLFREDNIYSLMECFALEPIEVVKCDIIEFRRCKSIMKSVKKLPKLIYSRFGSSLKEVTALDDETEFKPTTPSQYRKDKLRGFSDYKYYYIKDDYLYLLDCEVPRVNLYLITLETDKVTECGEKDSCKSLWDFEFTVPDKLSEAVISETIKEVSMRLGIPQDENPNLNSNEK